ADPVVVEDLPDTVLAVYVENGLRLSAVVGLELSLAAFAGAALGLIPAGGAEDCVTDKVLSPVLAENVTELCNVLSGLLNRSSSSHHRLHRLYLPGEELPGDASAHLLAFGQRLDLNVNIARYGAGRF